MTTHETNGEVNSSKKIEELDEVVIRFAGDSGDGMQLTGDQFTTASAMMGEDVATLPDYPSEIRAPAGTVFGVSGFQLRFGGGEVFTPGDEIDVLIAMNPAAFKTNLASLKDGGIVVVNEDAFTQRNLEKAGYSSNPLDGEGLGKFKIFRANITKLTQNALTDKQLSPKQVDLCKNFLALGLTYWLFNRSMDPTKNWLKKKFQAKPALLDANLHVLQAGWNFGNTAEMFTSSYSIRKQEKRKAGVYRYITGNTAAALGLIAAAKKSGLRLFLGSYPITPATDILHEVVKHKQFATVFQAEDEIAGIGSAVGAAFGGALAVTTTSGPGLSLKSEFIGLAVMTELPLIIVDVQRAGPSTGLPTKTEQSDLFQAIWGRHGESPAVVLAASSPRDCFDIMLEAATIALKYMTPVIVLTDGYLGNGAEVWHIPSESELPEIKHNRHTKTEGFQPYKHDPETLGRPWAVPGTPGLEHRIGGLEKEDGSGAVSHSPVNHEKMCHLRANKVAGVAREYAPTTVYGDPNAKVLVVGWGSTAGVIKTAVKKLNSEGTPVASINLRHLNPLPSDLQTIMKKYPKIVVAENNLGQLWQIIRAQYLLDVEKLAKITGQPFRADEIETKVHSMIGGLK
ncbi:MAG TPA: 2-oxoglutarate ferredoxin oxidoreductase subunit alpha [Bdellovibrionales bacterium]|nr:MAG: 2-oxoglutarate ferredoxin oxidoreductase subunit alpha [Bdellovibrionales bacterium GWB1_52_6]OFZ05821.1 MAG: 2-oxoglutarate ferredoxin oxidoreductase subunit alpha [Bdellovibrionales bacterium GWA1_52_35]OFZ39330.1 MAG: 2-oxoglutarate ferredoxin oxidoreductase subunit alpha [Bdellovibrionales bacterium GWC1_52_8]HAR42697.1 2-oxoglutarate ferredoxin oxidoreductase subunit alpha [Bdellovibrionales bacterium]HCM40234.1 2-oxoglutarate ferredoxin oxidoreductase subunit alpha [Bdellovibriona